MLDLAPTKFPFPLWYGLITTSGFSAVPTEFSFPLWCDLITISGSSLVPASLTAHVISSWTVGETGLGREMSISHQEQRPDIIDLTGGVGVVHSLFCQFKHFLTPTMGCSSRWGSWLIQRYFIHSFIHSFMYAININWASTRHCARYWRCFYIENRHGSCSPGADLLVEGDGQ